MKKNRILLLSFVLALIFETGFILASSLHLSSAHPQHEPDASTEVDVLTLPDEAPVLKSESKAIAVKEDETVSTRRNAPVSAKALSDTPQNIVAQGKPMSANHGPILIDSPSPVIPDYLKNHDLSTKVLIEFSVSADGSSSPRLLVSSGDEELDQIALQTAAKWKFYPAEASHVCIPAKVRLRILFTVK